MKIFPDLAVPGYLLSEKEIDHLIEKASEVLEELAGETVSPLDKELLSFIENACKLRAQHDKEIKL